MNECDKTFKSKPRIKRTHFLILIYFEEEQQSKLNLCSCKRNQKLGVSFSKLRFRRSNSFFSFHQGKDTELVETGPSTASGDLALNHRCGVQILLDLLSVPSKSGRKFVFL